jgi:murein L,D-transpeptidase YafK
MILRPLRRLFQNGTLLALSFSTLVHAADSSGGDASKPEPKPFLPPTGTAPDLLVQLGHGQYFSRNAFVMDKANRTLSVWKQEGDKLNLVTAVAADFGRNSGAKQGRGDYKTPEGIYFFQELRDSTALDFGEFGSHVVRAFTLDYPNYFDVLQHKSGSGIWLHTAPDSISLWRGSKGCVVVRSQALQELAPLIALKKTPILIRDSVNYVDAGASTSKRTSWKTWIENWRTHWQGKDIDGYIANYAPEFKSMGMDRERWLEYKKNLAGKYKFISVALNEPIVVTTGNETVIRFLQDYKSDQNSDFGEKTLYLRQQADGKFLILGEEWTARTRDDIVAGH